MMASSMWSLLFNKPFRILSHFTDRHGRSNLADFIKVLGVYAAGRLDFDSEGLIVPTDDRALQKRISDPKSSPKRPTGCRSKARPMTKRSPGCGVGST